MDASDIPLDSQDGLKALCKACMVPENVTNHIVASGVVSVALLGHAISDMSEVPDFIESLKLDAAGMPAPPFSPVRSALTRLLVKSVERSQWNGYTGDTHSGGGPSQVCASKPKLTVCRSH